MGEYKLGRRDGYAKGRADARAEVYGRLGEILRRSGGSVAFGVMMLRRSLSPLNMTQVEEKGYELEAGDV